MTTMAKMIYNKGPSPGFIERAKAEQAANAGPGSRRSALPEDGLTALGGHVSVVRPVDTTEVWDALGRGPMKILRRPWHELGLTGLHLTRPLSRAASPDEVENLRATLAERWSDSDSARSALRISTAAGHLWALASGRGYVSGGLNVTPGRLRQESETATAVLGTAAPKWLTLPLATVEGSQVEGMRTVRFGALSVVLDPPVLMHRDQEGNVGVTPIFPEET
jgi:hypothetical protein